MAPELAGVLSPHVAAAAQSGSLRIDHRDPTFKCEMTIVLDGKPIDKKFELQSDGNEVTGTIGPGRTVSSLKWDGDALLGKWWMERPNGEMTIAFRYEVEDGGRRLRATEQLRGGGRDQDNVWVFGQRPI